MAPTDPPLRDSTPQAPATRLSPEEPQLLAEEALALDAWLEREQGFSLAALMGQAGARVADTARELIATRGLARVVVLVGPGNNGGDGLVAVQRLATGAGGAAALPATLWQPLPRSPQADVLAAAACGPLHPVPVLVVTHEAPALDRDTLLIDALFGVGLARPLDGAARRAVEHVRARRPVVLSVDLPSGLDGSTGEVVGGAGGLAMRADVTLTFILPKAGLIRGAGPALSGEVRVADLGVAREPVLAWLAERRRASASA